jgi:hypothetical protein
MEPVDILSTRVLRSTTRDVVRFGDGTPFRLRGDETPARGDAG